MKTEVGLPACPRCGAREAVPVAYGYPGPEAAAAQERGELVLGGCMIGDESPEFICGHCHAPLPWSGSHDIAD